MTLILPTGKRYNSVGDWVEGEFGMSRKEITPEWNIQHYTNLLAITKHSVARKKLQQELNWWLDVKDLDENIKGGENK